MSESHSISEYARHFMVTPYLLDPQGIWRPSEPTQCPLFEPGTEDACVLRVHHHRERKTGPCFPLTVLICHTHHRSFTLYPPGHVPYGRVSMAPVSADGTLLREGDGEEGGSTQARPLAWSDTLFGAALAAASGEHWSRESLFDDPRRRRTQGRWLEKAARVVGVLPVLGESLRQLVAEVLCVPHLVLRGAVDFDWSAASWQERGRAVRCVLDRIVASRILGDQITAAGGVAGAWGRPSRWHPGKGLHALF